MPLTSCTNRCNVNHWWTFCKWIASDARNSGKKNVARPFIGCLFSFDEGSCYFFRAQTSVASSLNMMVLAYKEISNHFSKHQFVVLLFAYNIKLYVVAIAKLSSTSNYFNRKLKIVAMAIFFMLYKYRRKLFILKTADNFHIGKVQS